MCPYVGPTPLALGLQSNTRAALEAWRCTGDQVPCHQQESFLSPRHTSERKEAFNTTSTQVKHVLTHLTAGGAADLPG